MSNPKESGPADDLDSGVQKPSLVEFLLGGPKLSDADAALLAERNRDSGREVEVLK